MFSGTMLSKDGFDFIKVISRKSFASFSSAETAELIKKWRKD